MNRIFKSLLVASVLAIASVASQASPLFFVHLDGPSEAPPNASPGTGTAWIDFDPLSHMMHVQVEFEGLLGGVTASHIHAATTLPGAGTAPVATQTPTFVGFPMGVTSGTYDHTFDMLLDSSYRAGFITANGGTAATAEVALLQAMLDGKAYLNIHSTFAPGGEIRGFLQEVPEPGTYALLGAMGVSGVLFTIRRRRKA